jgi:hypothetical protein
MMHLEQEKLNGNSVVQQKKRFWVEINPEIVSEIVTLGSLGKQMEFTCIYRLTFAKKTKGI